MRISSNVLNVTGLDLEQNKKIEFLPVGLHLVFPQLYVLDGSKCSIKEVTKVNFHGLKDLSHLWLRDNKIKLIESETFRGLDSLIHLDLSKKYLNFDIMFEY